MAKVKSTTTSTKMVKAPKLDLQKVMDDLQYEPNLETAVRAYVEENWEGLAHDAAVGGAVQFRDDPEAYATESIQNAIDDGAIDPIEPSEADDDGEAEQPIIEVSQDEVKKALKSLLAMESTIIAMLYEKHEEYNQKYFGGKLAIPLITIEKMSNKTLGNYTFGHNNLPVKNHIRFNNNFIALNQENEYKRILETLRHEMIHQWQDQILYAPQDSEVFLPIDIPKLEGEEVSYTPGAQKKRPKDWHNADFRAMAQVVDIPAKGPKCTGNPANMPEPKSYNRKFVCGCIASNGYPVTLWSTRTVHAQCTICGNEFQEVEKKDKKSVTIEVNKSHVEGPNQDGIQDDMQGKYTYFERFETKLKQDNFLHQLPDDLDEKGGFKLTELEKGVYQKGHNAFQWGYRYWVAYNTNEIHPDTIHADDVAGQEAEPKELPKQTKKKGKADPEEKKQGKLIKFPEPDKETPVELRTYDIDNPEDLMEAYKVTGSSRGAAELFKVNQSTFIRRVKKLGLTLGTAPVKK